MYGEQIGAIVEKLVDESGKSVREIEIEAGLPNGTIGKLKYRNAPSVATVKKLADYFKKSMEYMIGEKK